MLKYSRREFFKTASIGCLGTVVTPSVAATLLMGCATTQTDKPSVNYTLSPIRPPANGCYIGMYPYIISPKDWYPHKIGVEPKIVIPLVKTFMVYLLFPITLSQWITEKGSIPFYYKDLTHDIRIHGFNNLVDNPVFTRETKAYARGIVKFGKPLFLSTMREMNAPWFPWGNNQVASKKVWKYMWQIFEDEGANDYATWVWDIYCPVGNVSDPRYFYPGDKYVDWIGLSAYSLRKMPITAKSFSSLVSSTYHEIFRDHANKPIMIAKFAKTRDKLQAKWFEDAFDVLKSWQGVKAAVCWSRMFRGLSDDATFTEETFEVLRKKLQDPYFISAN